MDVEVAECSLRRLGGKQVIVIPGIRFSILGRLAQMPVLQPITQWITRAPRAVPSPEQSEELCPELS